MARKTATASLFTTRVPAESVKRASSGRAVSEEVKALAEEFKEMHAAREGGVMDLSASEAHAIIRTARSAAAYANLGVNIGIETANGAVAQKDVPKEDDGNTYRVTVAPKDKTSRPRKAAETDTQAVTE